MKALSTSIAITLMAIVFLNFNASAKIWRVNNNGNNPVPAIVSDFPSATTLQQVNDNATVASGDTIHLEQSPTTYGACIFTKKLIVIGAGYFLSQNPNTQVNTSYGTKVGNLTFYDPASASSFVYGCEVGNVYMGVNGLTIARCYMPSGLCYIGNNTTGNIDGMNIRQCFFAGSTAGLAPITNNTGTGTVTNMNINGNILKPTYFGISLDARVSGIFKNNVLSNTYYSPINLQNFYVVNNLCTNNGNGNSFTNCTVEYNSGVTASQFFSGMSGSGTTYGTGNTTQTLAQMAFLAGASTDGYYQLGAASTVAGNGKGGNDLGAFSGDYPYKLSGIAPVPNIYSLTIASIPAGATTISVTVTAKGNN